MLESESEGNDGIPLKAQMYQQAIIIQMFTCLFVSLT